MGICTGVIFTGLDLCQRERTITNSWNVATINILSRKISHKRWKTHARQQRAPTKMRNKQIHQLFTMWN